MSGANLVVFLVCGALQQLHEGTIRYLKEKNLWKAAHQTRQDQLVELARKRVAGFQAAVAEAKKAGLRITAGDEAWTKFWTDYQAKHGMDVPYGEAVLGLG